MIREQLTQKGFVSKSSVLDAKEIVQRESGELAQIVGSSEEARASAETIDAQGRQLVSQFIADNANALGTALAKLAAAKSELSRAEQRLRETTIRAPIDGTLQQLAISSRFQVLSPGQQIATVVPTERQFRVQALLPNQDVGFVKVGQPALLKFSAYPSIVYGTLPGRVSRLSQDAVSGPEAENAQSDRQGRLGPAAAGASSVDRADLRFVYPMEVVVSEADVRAFGHDIKPGMSVAVEIVTGSRRLIGLILAPLIETVTAAGHSR
jgi:hemolysin D